MKKFLLLFILLASIILASCSTDKTAKTKEKLSDLYNENSGYITKLEMKILTGDKESVYKMQEKYTRDGSISLEILEPKESEGIIIEYKDDKIFLNHSSIKQSISLKAVKNLDKGILLASFFENLDSVGFIEEIELDEKDYFVIEFTPENTNKYNNQRIVYLEKKTLEPHLMEIRDENGDTRVIIKYYDFKYKKDI